MKTLVVLLTLVSVTLAAPRLQEHNVGTRQNWHTHTMQETPTFMKRHRKSTLELPTKLDLEDTPNMEISTDVMTPTHTARSFGLKKPVIVKNKFGYRLYRDSEEEKANADLHESCGRQVKVKLCDEDGKFREMLRNSGHQISDELTSEADMKHSIILAKEAIESLQRDLRKMEQKSATDSLNSNPDSDLHEDFEVTRQALDDVHKNFENLDTLNFQPTALTDSATMHDLHLRIANTEEERMAQWKTAMNNIHKNVEIVQNIENSFKVAGGHLDQPDSVQDHYKMKETDHITPEHVSDEQHARENQHGEEDIEPSASELVEMKIVDIGNHHTLRSENQRHLEHEKYIEELSLDKAPEQDMNTAASVAFERNADPNLGDIMEQGLKDITGGVHNAIQGAGQVAVDIKDAIDIKPKEKGNHHMLRSENQIHQEHEKYTEELNKHGIDVSKLAFKNSEWQEKNAEENLGELVTDSHYKPLKAPEQDMNTAASVAFERNADPNLGDIMEQGLKDITGGVHNAIQGAGQVAVDIKDAIDIKPKEKGNHHMWRSENQRHLEHEKYIEELKEHGTDISNLAFKNSEWQEKNAEEKMGELVTDSRYKPLKTPEQDMNTAATVAFERNAEPNLGDIMEQGLKDFTGGVHNAIQGVEQVGSNIKDAIDVKPKENKMNHHILEQNENYMRTVPTIEMDHLAMDDVLLAPLNSHNIDYNESDHTVGSTLLKTAEDNTNHHLSALKLLQETEDNLHLDETRHWKSMKTVEDSDQMTSNYLHLMQNHHDIDKNEAEHTVPLTHMKSVEEPSNPHLTGLTAMKAAQEKHHTLPPNMHWSNEDRHFKTAFPSDQEEQKNLHLQHTLHNIDSNESGHTATLPEMKSAQDNLNQHLTTLTALKSAEDSLHRPEPMSSNTHWRNENRHFSSMKATYPSTQEDLYKLLSQNIDSSDSEHSPILSEMKSAEDTSNQHLTTLTAQEVQDHLNHPKLMPSTARWSNENRHFGSMRATHLSPQDSPNDYHSKHKHPNINHKISEQALPEMEPAENHLHHLTTLPAMKAADLEATLPEAHWITKHKSLTPMKVYEDIEKNRHEHNHMRYSDMTEHHFVPHKVGPSHGFEPSNHANHHNHPGHHNQHEHHHTHLPQTHHHNMNLHGDVPSHYNPSFRDAMEGIETEHSFQWKPSHESFRNSYGAGPIGSVGGAVGVFPNANTGGCGIPLLLSCSPSVVSGSLAKAHPGSYGAPSFAAPSYAGSTYNAPSYRTEDDFGFHNKRETKKTNEIRTTNVLRSPTITKHKTTTILDNKM